MCWMVWRPTRPWAYLLTNILVSKLPDILLIRLSHNTSCIIPIHPIYAIIIIIFSFLSHSKKNVICNHCQELWRSCVRSKTLRTSKESFPRGRGSFYTFLCGGRSSRSVGKTLRGDNLLYFLCFVCDFWLKNKKKWAKMCKNAKICIKIQFFIAYMRFFCNFAAVFLRHFYGYWFGYASKCR